MATATRKGKCGPKVKAEAAEMTRRAGCLLKAAGLPDGPEERAAVLRTLPRAGEEPDPDSLAVFLILAAARKQPAGQEGRPGWEDFKATTEHLLGVAPGRPRAWAEALRMLGAG